MTKIAIVSSGTPTKENVKCDPFEENRRVYELEEGDRTIEKEHVMTVVKCNLNENSGFPYSYFGFNISDVYNFIGYSEIFNSEKNSNKLFEISLENGDLQLLPNGFEMIFPHINSLNITKSGLALLRKQNLKQFGKHLKVANFSGNFLTSLTVDLFQYNENILQCDFSDNYLAHIDSFFLEQKKIHFNFNKTACFAESKGIINPNDCIFKGAVLIYKDFEFHMRREFEEIEMFCSVSNSCSNYCKNEDCHVSYNCSMTKNVNPRTFVSKNKTQISNVNNHHNDGECKLNSSKVTLEFINNHIEFIPEKIVETIAIENIETFKIIRSDLVSINELDMKQFGRSLIYADFSYNVLLSLGKNVFKHNPNLKTVYFKGNTLYYIDPKYNVIINNGAVNRSGE